MDHVEYIKVIPLNPTDWRIEVGDCMALTLWGAKELHKQLGETLEVLARQRITNAQDTVDQIRSDNALRSDFV
jgi:hypothetical protein